MNTWQRIKQDPSLKSQYLVREQVIDALREFFKTRGFHEVETPLLVKHPGTEPYLEVFGTQLKYESGKSQGAYLLTSPEYAMKKLLVAGMGNIFQICKSFRNGEGESSRHNSEFTILEYYRVDADYTTLMQDMEDLFLHLFHKVQGKVETAKYQGRLLDLSTPFTRITVAKAFEQYAQVTAEQLTSDELIEVAQQKGYSMEESTWDDAFYQIFLNEVEPNLNQPYPIILYDYPIGQAALSKPKTNDPRFAERFEIYFNGIEIGNAFSELTDADEQERRLKEELEQRKALSKSEYTLDTDFITALRSGMPESAGIAIGVDRLVMLLADVPSIQDTLFFPQDEVFD